MNFGRPLTAKDSCKYRYYIVCICISNDNNRKNLTEDINYYSLLHKTAWLTNLKCIQKPINLRWKTFYLGIFTSFFHLIHFVSLFCAVLLLFHCYFCSRTSCVYNLQRKNILPIIIHAEHWQCNSGVRNSIIIIIIRMKIFICWSGNIATLSSIASRQSIFYCLNFGPLID